MALISRLWRGYIFRGHLRAGDSAELQVLTPRPLCQDVADLLRELSEGRPQLWLGMPAVQHHLIPDNVFQISDLEMLTDIILLQLVRGVRGFLHPMPGLKSPDELLVGLKAGVRGPREAEQLP